MYQPSAPYGDHVARWEGDSKASMRQPGGARGGFVEVEVAVYLGISGEVRVDV